MKLQISNFLVIILIFITYGLLSIHTEVNEKKEINEFNEKYSTEYLGYKINSLTCLNLYLKNKNCLEDKNGNIKIF